MEHPERRECLLIIHNNNSLQIFYPQLASAYFQTVSLMKHSERRERLLTTPQQIFSSSFVFSTSVGLFAEIIYAAFVTDIAFHLITTKIPLEFSVLNLRPTTSGHTYCVSVFLTLDIGIFWH